MFEKADYLPSFTEKRQSGTVRLLFRRRQTAESFDLLLVTARGIIDVDSETDSNGTTKLTIRINPKALSLVVQLLKSHQVALVIDAKTEFELDFVRDALVDRMHI